MSGFDKMIFTQNMSLYKRCGCILISLLSFAGTEDSLLLLAKTKVFQKALQVGPFLSSKSLGTVSLSTKIVLIKSTLLISCLLEARAL